MRALNNIPKSGKLYNAMQDGEDFKKYCLRYGTILNDVMRESDGNHFRHYKILIQGLNAEIKMLNGNVTNWKLYK